MRICYFELTIQSSIVYDLVVLGDRLPLSVEPWLASKILLLFRRRRVKASKVLVSEDSLLEVVEPGWICILQSRMRDMSGGTDGPGP